MPIECEADDLHNKAILQPLMNLGIQAASVLPLDCVVDPYMSQRCAWARQGWEYYQGLYNVLVLLGNDTPRSKGSVSCAVHAQEADSASYAIMAFTGLFIFLAFLGAGWKYMYATAQTARKNASTAASSSSSSSSSTAAPSAPAPLPSPGSQPVAVTVKSSPGRGGSNAGDLSEIPLEDSTTGTSSPGKKSRNKKNKAKALNTAQSSSSSSSSTAIPAASTRAPVREPGDMVEMLAEVIKVPPCPKSIAAFSLVDNWNEVFTLKSRGGEFAVFDGMKAISACWVVFYHVLLWQIYFVQNPEYLIPPQGLLSKTWATPFFNYSGTLSVDTFFFISGFLASYMLLLKLDKEQAKGTTKPAYKWIPSLYFHRWMRITPAYLYAFFIHWKIAPLLSYGPLAQTVWESNTRPCKGIWWSHFLYLNDLYPWWNQRLGEVCYGHSWYLANDMQYYLLVPLFCLLYRSTRWNGKKLATYAVWACLLCCIITSWVLSIKDHWSPNSWDGVEGDHYREEGFSRPWTRCSSYMIGILFSYMWYEKKVNNPDYKFLPFQANFLWVMGLFLLAISMYGPHTGSVDVIPCNLVAPGSKCGSGWSPSTKAAIIALLRPTWTLGLGCLSVLCWNNQGGFIQKFLAAAAWGPLNTLSFCIYLVHYTVLTYYISQRTLRIRFELFGFLNTFFGLMAISCGLALFVVLLVEKPFMKLQKIWFEAAPVVPPKKKELPAATTTASAPPAKAEKKKEVGKVELLEQSKKASAASSSSSSSSSSSKAVAQV